MTVELVPIHQQKGGEDCDVFAVAFTVELAFGGDPHTICYKQEAMRDHLKCCLRKCSPFPPW